MAYKGWNDLQEGPWVEHNRIVVEMAHKEAGVGKNVDSRFRLKGNWEPFGGRDDTLRREAIAKNW